MRILLLKSLLLCTNYPSFLPILCGILFVSAVDAFVYISSSFLFLLWICFCRGYLCVYSFFLFVFVFSSLVPSIFSHEIRKTWEFFWKKSIVFLFFSEMLRSYDAFKCACERKSMPSINPSAWFFSLLYLRKGRGLWKIVEREEKCSSYKIITSIFCK